MSNTSVVRQDIVQILFDTNLDGLTQLQKEMNAIKKSLLGGLGDEELDKVTKSAKKTKKGVEGVGDELDKGKKQADKFKDGLKGAADTDFSKLKKGIGKVTSALGKGVATAAKIGAAAITASAAAVGTLVTQSVSAYAEFEQLKGGVETLFGAGGQTIEDYAKSVGKSVSEVKKKYGDLKEAENLVFKNANNAYKTAGLSANDYMTTVTGFSASLVSSLGGDTVKAAKVADKALSDMADNANKMGTPMENIQNAYQAFAKQNYMLLDNLKLGYGGTKTEMERLLKDAEKISGVKYDISSYADIIEAIHIIQKNMGITGTTAKEAEKTITGSFNSMKAAWGNLLPALVKGGDSFDQCVENLVSTVKIFAGNIMPAIKSALSGIGDLFVALAPTIEKELPSFIDELLPPLITAAVALVQGLIKALPSIVKTLVNEIPDILKSIGKTIVDTFGEQFPAVQKMADFFGKIGDFFAENSGKIQKAIPILLGLVVALKAFKGVKAVASFFSGFGKSSKNGGKGGLFGNITETFKELAKTKTSTVLKGMANLAIIIGGITLIAAALMFVAPYMAQLTDAKSLIEVIAVIAVLGLVGTGLAKLGEIAGKIPVSTVAKGLANMAIMIAGMSVLFLVLGAVSLINFDYGKILAIAGIIAVLGIIGTALAIFGGIVGLIPVAVVALGLANMAIMIAGMSALFLLIGAISLLNFDYKKMLIIAGMIAILGVIGTALSIFAGIVGLIPIVVVALGLANMAIVIAGMSALLLLIGAVSLLTFDYKKMLNIVGMLVVLGAVGTALTIFAGIAGIVPIPVVLAGLTNIGLVLGGLTGLIVAFGELTKIQGFTEFLEIGGQVLVKIMNILGEMVGALAGGLIEGLSSCLPALGENLGKFGENIKPLFTSIAGVDMAGVGAFFTALVGLLGIATGKDIIDGIKSFFGGEEESALSKLGTELCDFATNSKGFFETVAKLAPKGFSNAKLMFESLASMKDLPKEGGVKGWFNGELNYENIASGLAQLSSENVIKFFNTVADIKQAGFDSAKSLFDCLSEMKSLPKEGGVRGWFSGDLNYESVASGLGALTSEDVTNFFTMVGGLKQKAFDNTKLLFETLAGIKELPKEGGWWDKVTGDETTTLSNIATDLSTFGEKTSDFFTQVNGLNLNNLNGLWVSLEKAGTMTATSLASVIDESISSLVSKISQLPKKMGDALRNNSKGLSNGAVDMWKDAVKATVAPVNKLLSAANWILEEFGSSKRVISWKPYANGTNGHKGGNALVNDGRGAELVQMPNGYSFIPRGRNVLIPNAPKGMKVLPAEQTAQLMGRKSTTFRYADGIGNIDIWSFIDNSKGLVEKIGETISYEGMSAFASNVGKGIVSTFSGEMPKWIDKLFNEAGILSLADYVASKGVMQWRTTVIRALKMEGQYSVANVARTLFQMQTESGGNPYAINLWDSNAKKGTPSKGLMQVIDPTFRAYARAGFNSNIYDPLSNILASIRYAVARYGTLANAYRGVGYANGGLVTKTGLIAEQNKPEMVIPLAQNKRNRALDLYNTTGELLGLSAYTPENSTVASRVNKTENNNYNPQFILNINGTSDERSMKRKVKSWVKESFDEIFASMGRSNDELQEV